jgi:predicted DNA-binding transcriptional regulator AlpA
MEKYLEYKEIAETLSIPIRSLYEYNKQGTGPKTTKIGRHLRVAISDFRAWVESNTLEVCERPKPNSPLEGRRQLNHQKLSTNPTTHASPVVKS